MRILMIFGLLISYIAQAQSDTLELSLQEIDSTGKLVIKSSVPATLASKLTILDSVTFSTKAYRQKLADSVNGLLTGKQATLVSGTNIKTINGSTVLGSGDLVVSGAVAANTAGVGTSPTASGTQQITHNLGRTPVVIRIYGYGSFTSNAAATATTSSMGVFNSSGNFCVYQRYGAAITTTQAGLSSNTFSILLATGGGNFISGVIQNVTGTTFDIVWTETGTATAQVFLWEAQ